MVQKLPYDCATFDSNHVRAEVTVKAPHVNLGICNWVCAHGQCDDIISLQVEHSASVQGTIVCSSCWRLNHGDDFVVHINVDSSRVMVVNLCVDVVPSRDGHSQFSVCVRHATCKMAVWGACRKVFDHWKAN